MGRCTVSLGVARHDPGQNHDASRSCDGYGSRSISMRGRKRPTNVGRLFQPDWNSARKLYCRTNKENLLARPFFNEFSVLTLEKIITLLCNYYQKGSSAARFQWFSVKFVTLATWPGGLASPFSWNRSWDEMIPSNIEIQLFAKISRSVFDKIKISKEINSSLIEIGF